MKALILAAGKGTRLRPLTNNKPKVMVGVGEKTLIEHLIEDVKSLGIKEISIIEGYMSEKLESRLESYDGLKFLEQEEQLGTAHAVDISDFQEPFLVLNGDVYIHKDNVKRVLDGFRGGRYEALIGTKEVDNPEEFGVLEVENDLVRDILEKPEKPPSNLINTGVYVFTPLIYKYIRRTELSERGEYEITDSIKLMLKGGHSVGHVPFEKYWIDVGRHEDLKKARKLSD